MKDANMLAKIVAGAAAYDEAEFIVANDDHIALKPAQHCDLLPVEIPDGYRLPRPSPYIQNVKRTRDHVKQLGSSPQRVEGHLPILLSRSSIHEAGDSEIVSNGIIWQDLAVGNASLGSLHRLSSAFLLLVIQVHHQSVHRKRLKTFRPA
ncbi:MAG: hypothetical protein AAF357_11550, partial [Verrucomicrobiota bacterium]